MSTFNYILTIYFTFCQYYTLITYIFHLFSQITVVGTADYNKPHVIGGILAGGEGY